MQPISRRTLLAMAAVAAPLALLSACGDDNEEDTGSSSPDDTSSGSSPPAADALTGTVNFLNFTGWAGPTTYADFAAAFPGASVNEIAWASNDDTISKAKGRAGDIDVVLVDGTTFPRLTALGVLAELGDVPNMSLVADQYKGNSWDPDNARLRPHRSRPHRHHLPQGPGDHAADVVGGLLRDGAGVLGQDGHARLPGQCHGQRAGHARQAGRLH